MTNPFLRKSGLLFTTLFLTGGMLAAQQNPTMHSEKNQSAATSQRKMTDQSFVKEAAEGGTAEVKLGKLAQEKGNTEAVKDFGKRMVTDHSKANEKLQDAASQANINVPQEQTSAKQQAAYERLSKLSGPAFDHAYARMMLRDHEKDVAAFRKEAKNGKQDSIKNFAANTLPVLEQHLALARQMNQKVHPGSANGSQTGSTGAMAGPTSR
ncbi:MAG TPA: DUF4142 domain-containing protein [Terriglobia bacterium]|nr:DUF4142 domain-containing protein [Terriglobia bacterium]